MFKWHVVFLCNARCCSAVVFMALLVLLGTCTVRPRGRSVVELGAGLGLPSLVCATVGGARRVVLTDYPDALQLDSLRHNVRPTFFSVMVQRAFS